MMRLLYVSVHGTVEGQTGWADIDEVVPVLRARGWHVDLHQPPYLGAAPPGLLRRLRETVGLQLRSPTFVATMRSTCGPTRSHSLSRWPPGSSLCRSSRSATVRTRICSSHGRASGASGHRLF